MVEPPVIGFTGVVWPARPTEELSRALTTGPGAAPMADAGAAWTRLAASFGAAVIEYDRIMAEIRESWRSPETEPVLARIATLRDWLVDAAASAAENATRAGNQAVAYEVARLAMPHLAEITALEEAKRDVEQAGAALGAPLVAAAAEIAGEQDIARTNAARVMQSYESATTPLADPWPQPRPPVIASAAALEAEQGAATGSTSAPTVAALSRGGYVPSGGVAMPRAQVAYRAQVVARSVPATTVVPGQSVAVPAEGGASRVLPGGMAPAGAMNDVERPGRAGAAAARPGEELNLEAGFDAAPPVLGAAERAAAPAPEQTEARP